MSVIPVINLSRLLFPELAKDEPLEQIMADLKQRCDTVLAARLPEGSPPINLEAPLIQALFKTMAIREQRVKARINTAARGVMLGTASGTDLDHVAALHGVKRLEIGPSDVAGVEDVVLEDDERVRIRARLAMDALSQSGTEDEYRFHALSASAQLKDVSVFGTDEDLGEVRVCLLSQYGRGGAEEDADPLILEGVKEALQAVQSVTDTVLVNWATIFPYHVKATLILEPGAEPEPIQPLVLDAVTTLIRDNHRLGKDILRDEFFAAMYQVGVAEVVLDEPAADRAMDLDTAPFNAADPEDEDTLLQISIVET